MEIDIDKPRLISSQKQNHSVDENQNSHIPSSGFVNTSAANADLPQRSKAEIEASLEKFALGGLANLYHSITGKTCERYVALGMATCAVSSLLTSHAELKAQRDELLEVLNTRAEREIEMLAGVAIVNDALVAALKAILDPVDGPARAVRKSSFKVWDDAYAALALAEKPVTSEQKEGE